MATQVDKNAPSFPNLIKVLFKNKRGCQHILHVLNEKIHHISKAQQKWKDELFLDDSVSWEKVFMMSYHLTSDPNLKWLQLRLLHRILTTNTYLKRIKILEDDSCSYCKNSPETLQHLFWTCPIVSQFWNSLFSFFTEINLPHERLSFKMIIFGTLDLEKNTLLNLLLLLAKQYIYNSKFSSSFLSVKNYLSNVKKYYFAERHLALKNEKNEIFRTKWCPISDYFVSP